MNLATDMKKLHAKKFKAGEIRQATFLKSFKKEILDLVDLGYKPLEIKDYLESKLEVTINMNSFYAWLNYSKKEDINNPKHGPEYKTQDKGTSPVLSDPTEIPGNALDVLASTDFD